jgi:hypothetical protein
MAPRPNPVIIPGNVHLDVAPTKSLAGRDGVKRIPGANRREPDTIRYAFNFPAIDAITLAADIQVGLHAKSDRALCDLQLMQFVTPKVATPASLGRTKYRTSSFSTGIRKRATSSTTTRRG